MRGLGHWGEGVFISRDNNAGRDFRWTGFGKKKIAQKNKY